MISLWLRTALALELALAWVAVAALAAGASLLLTLAGAVSAVLLGDFVLLALGHTVARHRAARRGQAKGSSAGPGAGGGAAEILALYVLFVLIQPFERLWMGKDEIRRVQPGRYPVLLVHGYLCNRGIWWWLRRRLRLRLLVVATVNLEPPLADLDIQVECLARRIERLLAETGAGRVVLVTHSMGGLVSRAYLRRHGCDRVARLVMLATPHHGTQVARAAPGRDAFQMRVGSEWLQSLACAARPPIPMTNVWTRQDAIVVPAESARLPGAEEFVLEDLGHMALLFSRRVGILVEERVAGA